LAGRGSAADQGLSLDKLSRQTAELCEQAFGAGADLGGAQADHAQRGHFVPALEEHAAQCGFERVQDQLVETQRAVERIPAQAGDEIGRARQQAGLRASQELVAAEGHQIGALPQTGGGERLVDPISAQIRHAAAAQILVHRNPGLAAEGHQILERRARGETGHAEIAGMDAEQQARALADGRAVVFDAGAVGGADLAERGTGVRHDFGDAKAVADLDQFAAGDDGLAAAASSRRARKTAAALLLTAIPGFPSSRSSSAETWTSRLPRAPEARSYSRFE